MREDISRYVGSIDSYCDCAALLVARRRGRQRSVLCATIVVKQRYLSGSRVEEGSAEIEQDGREVQHKPFARDRAPVGLPRAIKQLLEEKRMYKNNKNNKEKTVYLETRASDILLQDCADPLQHAFLDLGRGLNTSHTALAQLS